MMRTIWQFRDRLWVVAAVALLSGRAPLRGDDSAGVSPSAPAASTIEKLVAQLGDPSFAKRQAAEEALLEIGVPALAALDSAGRSEEIEIRLRANAVAGRINERRLSEAEIHVVGVYESGAPNGTVVVQIESCAKPVVLVVCARDAVQWEVRKAAGVELLKVIASGHHPQVVLGVKVPVQSLSVEGDQPAEIKDKAFYAYLDRGVRYEEMRERVKELTGSEPASFQGRHDAAGKPFVISKARE